MTRESFGARSEAIDPKSEDFLKLLVKLGGYCTVAHAEQLKLAESDRRSRGYLRRLEHLGFLRRVAAYPVVYQITKSTTRHLGRDSGARRRHPLATVQARLLAMDFYLEARRWPARFILDHEQKIRTFTEAGCPVSMLPQRGGRPYLREEFLFWGPGGRLGIALIDQPQIGALSQMVGLVQRFAPIIRYWGDCVLELLIASASQHRYYIYRRLLQHPKVLTAWPSEFEFAMRSYRVLRTTPPVAALLCPSCHRAHRPETPHNDSGKRETNPRRRATHVSSSHQKPSIADPIAPIHCDLID